ncbi:helix-turn-helix domain-containing protein [Lacrimispora amygdalina]|jgi:DNA-binding MarR family transcriptional regulator|uniref:Helix-turn-helix domain-containing protein n=2 Tax=Lacrimispora TaxID=2719231 RepID=A0ABX1VTN5_9FIRM|nr:MULTISPECIES: helix-turn-helix domain-containing protein [Clostridia]MDD3064398.1 helix-turn-helix domain-containing protein [Massilibacteroides sp.]MDD3780960.1 helix-turn-helix domain-containing protein [Proteiniphilum sp.]NNJ31395.1 helix-turn-helix domain-containing protein [Lacrimispora defluvii]RFZ80138.1 helix-turn-helix domain-containing protein [Clostridium indicum]
MSYFNHIYSASPDELPHRARAVYIYLRDRAGKDSDCWPAVKTIASDLQLSRSTVKRALHDLVKAGLIEKESRYRENGSNTSNRLILKK